MTDAGDEKTADLERAKSAAQEDIPPAHDSPAKPPPPEYSQPGYQGQQPAYPPQGQAGYSQQPPYQQGHQPPPPGYQQQQPVHQGYQDPIQDAGYQAAQAVGQAVQPGYGGQQQQSTVIVMQPQAAPSTQAPAGLGYPQGLRSWSTGLFGCFDDIGTCKSFFDRIL